MKSRKYQISIETVDEDMEIKMKIETPNIDDTVSDIILRGIKFFNEDTNLTTYVSPNFILYVTVESLNEETDDVNYTSDEFYLN